MIDTMTMITFAAIGFYEAVLLTGAVRLFLGRHANRIQKVFGIMLLYSFLTSAPYLIGYVADIFSGSLLAILNTLNTALLCFLPLTAYTMMQEILTLRHWLVCFAPILPEIGSWFVLSPDDYESYFMIDVLTYLYLLCFYIWMLFRLRRWDRTLLDVYSDVSRKQTLWYRHIGYVVTATFLLWIPLYLFPDQTWIWLLYCLINSILIFIITEYAMKQEVFDATMVKEVHSEPETISPAWVDRLNYLLEVEHIYTKTDLDLVELSKQVGVNRTYLSRHINQNLHTTFYEYINEYRIKEACKLLKSSDESIETIVQKSGFGSRQTLLRYFTKKYGMSPSDWRNKQ